MSYEHGTAMHTVGIDVTIVGRLVSCRYVIFAKFHFAWMNVGL